MRRDPADLPGMSASPRTKLRAVRVAEVAGRQGGVISAAQLRGVGLSDTTIKRWTAAGHLHRVHPGVFAVGHRAISLLGRLNAALLYAGDLAALSHQTAGWWERLITAEPVTIHVSEPGERRSLSDLRIHHPREVRIEVVNGLRCTPVPRTLRDLAWVLPYLQLRRAVAEADHANKLDPVAVCAELGRGRPGSRALRLALSSHLPDLARTFSVLEERFLSLVDEALLPLPEVNGQVDGMTVDCLWRNARLVVELDGHETHDRTAAIEADRRREMRLRRAGYKVIRYTWQQVTREPELVIAELRVELPG